MLYFLLERFFYLASWTMDLVWWKQEVISKCGDEHLCFVACSVTFSLTLSIKYLYKLSCENFKEHTHLSTTMSDLFHKTGAIYTIYTDICFIFRLNERWQSAHTVWCAEWACHGTHWQTTTTTAFLLRKTGHCGTILSVLQRPHLGVLKHRLNSSEAS